MYMFVQVHSLFILGFVPSLIPVQKKQSRAERLLRSVV
jgi:hypothetical protein